MRKILWRELTLKCEISRLRDRGKVKVYFHRYWALRSSQATKKK